MINKVVILVGPTAVGKTDISIDIAKELDGEIVSCDSMQIYKHFDVGSAKPSKEEMQGVPHYLIDEIDPFVNFSVSDYQKKAKDYIKDIFSRGKTPIVTGGTGLYVNALMYDMDFSKSASDIEYRESLEKVAEEHGNRHIHEMLKDIDPKSYKKIHFNNLRKVIRALEVYHVTGQTIDDFSSDLTKTNDYEYVLIGLTRNRKRLYVRINKRVDIMMEAGLIEEVKNLKEMGLNESNTSMQGIGYKEVVPYLNGMYDKEAMASLIKQNSRRYAKRQMTWFRRYDDIHWFDYDNYDTYEEMKEAIIQLIHS